MGRAVHSFISVLVVEIHDSISIPHEVGTEFEIFLPRDGYGSAPAGFFDLPDDSILPFA